MKENDFEGDLIVVEGPDGSGTTTQSKKLADELNCHWTSEPTQGKVGEKVEEMIRSEDYSAESIALVFAADRILHLEEEVIPKLKEGETVVSDRYYHSSLVYQPAFGADLEWVKDLNENVVRPDLTFILDVSSEEAFSRLRDRESDKINPDLFEDDNQSKLDMFSVDTEVVFEEMDFQKRVIHNYSLLEERLNENLCYIDGSQSIESVFSNLIEKVQEIE